MTDRYERIRAALAMGPTPGPWLQEGNWVYAEGAPILLSRGKEIRPNAFTLSVSPGPDRTREEAEANAALIAACGPDTIRELLAERDALRKALSRILENEASDWKFAEEFGGYVLDDELRAEAHAALSKENTNDH